MRILHFTSTLDKGSGVMNVLMNYARELKKDGIYFDFIYFNESDNSFLEEIKNNKGYIYKIDRPNISLKYRKYLNDMFGNIMDNYKYDILHIHDVYLTFLLAPISKSKGLKKVITHSHATSYSDKFINTIRNRILCFNLKRNATDYFSCSIAAGKFLYGKRDYAKNKVKVIRNAIDVEKFRFNDDDRLKIRNLLGFDENIFVLGNVGRLTKQKNQLYLIEIFNEVIKINNNCRLVIIGKGPLKEKINLKIKQLELEKYVTLIESTNDVNKYMSAFDLFVLPSIFEGLPLVGVEAQCNGLNAIFSSKVTEEIIFERATRIDLRNKSKWVDEIIRNSFNAKNDRQAGIDIVAKNNYDIRLESLKLSMYYRELLK